MILQFEHDYEGFVNHLMLYSIPDYSAGGLYNYFFGKIEPGSFLTCVLKNDLRGACENADYMNQRLLYNYVKFLYNEAPSGSWGSVEKYENWIRS